MSNQLSNNGMDKPISNGSAQYFALKKLKPYIRKKHVSADIPNIENYP